LHVDGALSGEVLWDAEAIIRALQGEAKRRGRPPKQNEWRRARTQPSLATIWRYFGSWNAALEAAGLATIRWRWTSEEIILALQDDARLRGRPPTQTEWQGGGEGQPTASAAADRFGSWNAALKAAGFPARTRAWIDGPRVTHDEVVVALQRDAERRGKSATAREWRESKQRPAVGTVINRFGSWNAALKAAGLPTRTPVA
jgi:Homing endonuclease associated repeat